MKIKILLLSLLSLCVWSASAQQYKDDYKVDKDRKKSKSSINMIYGVSAGYMAPYLDVDNGVDTSIRKGYKYGIMWGVDLGRIEIVPELWYSNFEIDFNDDRLKNKSIDMPIIASLDLPLSSLRLNVGPTFSLKCDNDLTLSNGKTYEFGRIKSSMGYVVGVSYTLLRHLLLDARFTGRMGSSTNELPTGSPEYNIKYYDLSFSVGYKF